MGFLLFYLTLVHTPFYGNAQYLDSLPDGFITGKWINKSLNIRIVPLNTKTWRNLNSFNITSKQNNEIINRQLSLTPAYNWPAITDSFSIQSTSYKLNFESDERITEVLPFGEIGNPLSYTHDEIEDIRYLFNFLACNQAFSIAQLNGLGFTDAQKDAKPNKEYYISALQNITPLIIREGVLPGPLKPPIPTYSINDKQILFEWPSLPFFYHYFGFQLERSFDGKKYTVLNNGPIINYHSSEKTGGFRSYFSFQDTLNHGRTMYYRLRGLDYFGAISDPGDPLIIRLPKIIPAPLLTSFNIQSNNLQLYWEFDPKYEKDITSFSIWESDSVQGIDKKRIKTNVDKIARTTIISNQSANTKFYFIEIIRPDAPGKFSFPIMVVKTDSEPPASPSDLYASMNEKGVVYVNWKPNLEPDLLGYRLFRSVDSLAEFALIEDTLLKNNLFEDSISLNTLTKKIYYRIAALDQNYNISTLSPIVGVQIVDTIRPSQPVFYHYTPLHTGILLKWYPSFSIDVKNNFLYKRRKEKLSDWELVKTTAANAPSDTIIDLNVTPGVTYEYTLSAIDYAGNVSLPSKPLEAKPLFPAFLPTIELFNGKYNTEKAQIQLEWQYNESGILEYWIYKNVKNEPLSLFKQVSSAVYNYEDSDVIINKEYTYFIKAVHENGRESKLSKPILVICN